MYELPKRLIYSLVLLIVCVSFYPAKDGYVEKRSHPWNIGINVALNLTKIEIVDAPIINKYKPKPALQSQLFLSM